MTSDRIKEIQETTSYPNSVSVQQALLQVWNECEQELSKERDMNHIAENHLGNANNAWQDRCRKLETELDRARTTLIENGYKETSSTIIGIDSILKP
jgi:hypothetical protein